MSVPCEFDSVFLHDTCTFAVAVSRLWCCYRHGYHTESARTSAASLIVQGISSQPVPTATYNFFPSTAGWAPFPASAVPAVLPAGLGVTTTTMSTPRSDSVARASESFPTFTFSSWKPPASVATGGFQFSLPASAVPAVPPAGLGVTTTTMSTPTSHSTFYFGEGTWMCLDQCLASSKV